ncbi:MAG: bifunctional adenosylcobinamide kinase/adenosylcobinamide-phosphate guanylyltransferase, partial [Pseudomonadota bacterium]
AINEDKTDAGSVGAIGRFPHRAIVIDCLTIWLNNLMHHQHDVAVHTDRLLACASAADTPV